MNIHFIKWNYYVNRIIQEPISSIYLMTLFQQLRL
jgi:hypothetical protein